MLAGLAGCSPRKSRKKIKFWAHDEPTSGPDSHQSVRKPQQRHDVDVVPLWVCMRVHKLCIHTWGTQGRHRAFLDRAAMLGPWPSLGRLHRKRQSGSKRMVLMIASTC